MKSEFTMTKEKTQNIKWIDFADGLNNTSEPPKGNTTSTPVGKRLEQWL